MVSTDLKIDPLYFRIVFRIVQLVTAPLLNLTIKRLLGRRILDDAILSCPVYS